VAEFLIKAQDASVPNSSGKWYAARIVMVEEDGYVWGGKEGPPKFGIIKVPGISKASSVQYMEAWHHKTNVSIITHDVPSDTYGLRIDSERVSVTGKNAFTLNQIENFFTNWNAVVADVQDSEILFTVSVYDAITSPAFWEVDVSSIVFKETSYDEVTGDHVVRIQQSPYSDAHMKERIETQGGVVIPPRSFSMHRSKAWIAFNADIKFKLEQPGYDRRRWYVTAVGMAALQAANGIITVTPTQFLSNIADGLDD